MVQESGGLQVSALVETVPGIASVLRNPVADAVVNMIRAGAGLGDFRVEDADELVQFAIRRGLVGSDEGERLLEEVRHAGRSRQAAPKAAEVRTRKPAAKAAPRRSPPKAQKRVAGRPANRKKR